MTDSLVIGPSFKLLSLRSKRVCQSLEVPKAGEEAPLNHRGHSPCALNDFDHLRQTPRLL